ncbi:MAG: TIGR03936 family radical SAM-associated protein [Oscillospiraceae bacterium]|nr:TIGR03936 family radical SAM-associated protein [Oscillospiraceae bacterium]
MTKLRLRYSKTDNAKYISHLDLAAAMRRAFIRAGLELEYSKGFNPHPYISVAMPLSVGMQSVCELMDVGLKAQVEMADLPGQITKYLPSGLEISEAYEPLRKFNELKWLEISGILYYDTVPQDICQKLKTRFCASNIEVLKKTKRGMGTIDIAEYVRDIEFSGTSEVYISAKISAQEPTIKPENILDALGGDFQVLAPDYAVFKRIEAFDSDMLIFR